VLQMARKAAAVLAEEITTYLKLHSK
jgi:hypothetical protein